MDRAGARKEEGPETVTLGCEGVGQAEETLLGPAAAENLEDVLVMDGVEGGSPDRRPLLPDLPHFRKRHYHLP